MKNTTPLWLAGPVSNFPAVDHDLDTDVVVVGGGITGASAALRLAEAGKRVILVEANQLCSGVTGHTTAHVTVAVDPRYQQIAKVFGKDAAGLVASSSCEALGHIADTVERFAIECDLRRVPGYLYAQTKAQREELDAELAIMRMAGLDVMLDETLPLPFTHGGAIRYADQLRIHPTRYVRGLIQAAVGLGTRVFEHTRVTHLVDGDRVALTTDGGHTIRASAAFCATHMPLNRFAIHPKLGHAQSYAMAFVNETVADALYWDMDDPYHYTRVADTDGKRWLIVGGSDHKTGEESHTEKHFDAVLDYARKYWNVNEPSFRWSSQVIESMDGLPFIGRNAGEKNIYVATGFSGNGLTYGTVAARLVSDLILGHPNLYAHLYDANRFQLRKLGKFIAENAHAPVHAVFERMKGGEVPDVEDVPPGEGRIVCADGKRLAVYRDEHDSVHAVSAICTHLGCVVKFNDAERTWDCPCHGSRFGVDGEVLEGPALQPLAAVTSTSETATEHHPNGSSIMDIKLKPISEQVMVITGASSGIGLATALTAARLGAKVVLTARSAATLSSIVAQIEQAGGTAISVEADVADRAQVENVADVALERFGRIDTWVNDAGVSIYGRLDQVSDEDSRRLFDVNFWGIVYGSLVALPFLKRQGGALINLGSEVSEEVVPLQGMYSASKHAIKGFTDALRVELEQVDKGNVAITLIQPTAVATPYPQHARNYMDQEAKLPDPQIDPQQVADAIVDAATHHRRAVKVGLGAKINTAMANLAPGLSEKLSAKQVDRQQYDEAPVDPEGTLYKPGNGGMVYGRGADKQDEKRAH